MNEFQDYINESGSDSDLITNDIKKKENTWEKDEIERSLPTKNVKENQV